MVHKIELLCNSTYSSSVFDLLNPTPGTRNTKVAVYSLPTMTITTMKGRKRAHPNYVEQEDEEQENCKMPETEQQGTPFVSCSFQDLGLCEILSKHMQEKMGFSSPTHIQQAAIPLLLSERDVLVNAETGTGKTVVYLAPIVHKLQANMKTISRTEGTYALVLVPTRELCLQVYEVVKQLVHRFQWLVPGYVMGGENRQKEKARLRKGITILIATPGRLLDHLQNTASFYYQNLRWIVFDEADRLLDLGFGKDIKNILSFLDSQTNKEPKNRIKSRQHLLLSATLGDEVMELASLSLRNPAKVGLVEPPQDQLGKSRKHSLDGKDIAAQAPLEYTMPVQLTQRYMKVPCNLRLVTLLGVLRMWLDASHGHKVVLFFSTCDSVDFHYALLNDFHWSFSPREQKHEGGGFLKCKSFRLHGNMSQQERTESFLEFNKQDSALLLCTDVAARGLDIPKVTHILQFDPPGDPSAYVHRVGRTARLGRKGEALLILQPCEWEYLSELKKHRVDLKELPFTGFWSKLFEKFSVCNIEDGDVLDSNPTLQVLQNALESFLTKQVSMKHLATDAFRSYVRSYAAHRGDLKSIFQVRKLHLGHVAKSFGLRDKPSLIGKSLNKKRSREAKTMVAKKAKRRKLKPASMAE